MHPAGNKAPLLLHYSILITGELQYWNIDGRICPLFDPSSVVQTATFV